MYREVARGMKKERRRQRARRAFRRSLPMLRRWSPLLICGMLMLVLLFGFVLRGARAVYVNGQKVAYVKNQAAYETAVDLLTSDVREDLGYHLALPEDIALKWRYVPWFCIKEPADLKPLLMEACGEHYAYRYVFFIGDQELGAVTARDKNATQKLIVAYLKKQVEAYSWAENVEVLDDVWHSFRLVEQQDYRTADDIAALLAERDDWFTIRYQYYKTESKAIPYDIHVTYTRELLETEAEVLSPGKSGLSSVVFCITEENGKFIGSDITSSGVVREAVAAEVRRGTRADTGYYFYAPVDSTKISSEFGYRILRGERNWHSGVDFVVPEGTEVYAAAAGVVTQSGVIGNGAYGNVVVIDHGDGFLTYYAHNSKLLVEIGDEVKKGTLIALSGNTGNSTGPHCHFEVRLNGEKINPFRYMARPAGH